MGVYRLHLKRKREVEQVLTGEGEMGAYVEQKKEVDDVLHASKLGKESLTILSSP
jgi:hypothetical protein